MARIRYTQTLSRSITFDVPDELIAQVQEPDIRRSFDAEIQIIRLARKAGLASELIDPVSEKAEIINHGPTFELLFEN